MWVQFPLLAQQLSATAIKRTMRCETLMNPILYKGESKKAVNGNCETLNTVLADTCARSNQHLLSQLSWDEHLPYKQEVEGSGPSSSTGVSSSGSRHRVKKIFDPFLVILIYKLYLYIELNNAVQPKG